MSFFSNIVGSINSAVDSVVDTYKKSLTFPNTVLRVNDQNYKISKLLGEGGFSFVYLAENDQKEKFAIKTIRCKMGKELVNQAFKEAIMTDRFQHKNIIRIVDMCMIEEDDRSKTIYIIMPYYKKGNFQDVIETSVQLGKYIPEKQLLWMFREVCQSVQVLAEYLNRAGEHIPWAHRDIKPANILISDDGKTPVLMDFGSARPARVNITNRNIAMKQQDEAAENCSMPYRAPELFEVKVGTVLDEKVDVWSLGCTLFAIAYGESPFEMTVNKQGGTLALAVLNRQFNFPRDKSDLYSETFQKLISWMLNSDPNNRPDIKRVVSAIDKILQK